MKVTLVQPPSNRRDTCELAPPLSLLTVGTALCHDDVDVAIVDLNLECLQNPANAGPWFYEWAVDRILATAPDLVGFTSMALESHVGLELARRLKLRHPRVRTVMGGPHFSAIAREVLTFYPWVDFVVVGEGEAAARGLVRALRTGGPLWTVPNVAFMDGSGFRLERVAKSGASLDEYPFPAYRELVDVDAYFALNPYRVLDVEANRGCALRCAFCYSAPHWGQGERTRAADRVVEDVHRHYELGARHLFFVGDNFLNSKAYGKAVADAIASANPGLTWRCYATLAQLSEDVVESLGRAACNCIFVGVDAVSERSKKGMQKSYFRGWPPLRDTLDRCLDHGITPTCAFLVHPDTSEQAQAESEAALAIATHVFVHHCGVRLNPLTVYTGTGLSPNTDDHSVEASNEKPRLLLDGHWITERNDFARDRPWLFPYHSTVGPPEHYAAFVRATHAAHTLLETFSRSLMQALRAGLPLWRLLRETAARVDYAADDKDAWPDREVWAFVDLVRAGPTTLELRDTLAVEEAEYALRRRPARAPVTLEIEGVSLDMWLMPHARVTLSRPPEAYDTSEQPAAPQANSAGPYLVVPRGAGMHYIRSTNETDALVHHLNRAAVYGGAVSAPADTVTNLLAANVITLPATPAQNAGHIGPHGGELS